MSAITRLGMFTYAALASACTTEEPRANAAPAASSTAPWTFAVLSDLHIPRDGHITIALRHAVAAVIRTQPRFVVITGDFTDGNRFDPKWRRNEAPMWWHGVRDLVTPIRAAGIPVLPIAGNHDSYLPIYRADYAAAWRDLDAWTRPLRPRGSRQPATGLALDAAPFCYSVDVGDVHLTLAHVVDQTLDPRVAHWIARDLHEARAARLKIVFGHVPLSSVATNPRRELVASFGKILADGGAALYVAGHEHLVWDKTVALPHGRTIEQVIVGTASASWRFGPDRAARQQAGCVATGGGQCCTMPRTGTPFELEPRHGTWYQAQAHTFTLFTVAGDRITARPVAIRSTGETEPFGEDCARHGRSPAASEAAPRRPASPPVPAPR